MNLTRREMLVTAAATFLSLSATGEVHSSPSHLSVEGYIWQQHMKAKGKNLGDGLVEFFETVRKAGFRSVELSNAFLTADLRDRVIELIQSNGLYMPSIYVGGAMHEAQLAEATIAQSLEIARFCKKVGCRAVIGDPRSKAGDVEKTDAELAVQAAMLDKMGKALAAEGFQYWVHNHIPEMVNHAREWWNTLNHTDPDYVWMCLDIGWVNQGGQDPLALLRAAGKRVACLHLRNSNQKVWLESFGNGDIDYPAIAAYLTSARLQPLLVVELAYAHQTVITRPLEEDLKLSRVYAEHTFRVKA